MSRQYSDSELAEIARPFEEHAIEDLRKGDIEGVRKWLKLMANGHAGLDALGGHSLARKVGKFRQDFGEEKTREALLRIGHELMKTWIWQYQEGDERNAIRDLIAVYRYQLGGQLQPLKEDADEVVLDLAPCGSGGRLERQGLPEKHPDWYGGWSDGISSYCQACKASQNALNAALGEDVWTTEKGDDGFCRMRFRKVKTRGETLFDEQERNIIVRTGVQQAEDRLAAGDLDIEPLLKGQRKEWMPAHDFGLVQLEYFYAIALEFGGADYLDELLAQTYAPAFEAGFPVYAAMTDDELVKELARTWNYHCADFTIEEEDDRFVFNLDPCGSGGRLWRGEMWRDMFHYGEPLSPIMNEPHPINFNRKRAPLYCTHCAASNRAQLKCGLGDDAPRFFVIDGHAHSRPGKACRQFSYKKASRREDMDPSLLQQVGIVPPGKSTDV